MDKLPVHMRITGLTVSNDDVDSRRKAITDLAAAWGKIKIPFDIVAKAGDIATALSGDGAPPAALASEVETVVQKKGASAFLSAESPLEVGICAGMAALSIMSSELGNTGWLIVDLYSNALWSALAFQSPLEEQKREDLRTEVLNRARERSLQSANLAREREAIPDLAELSVTIGEDNAATTNFKKVLQGTIEGLRRNAALDREELDFLWWAQLGRSRLLDRRLVEISEPARLVTMGIEGARLLRRFPADVHRELVLRTLDSDPQLDLAELIGAIGADRASLAGAVPANAVAAAPLVYPLFTALTSGTTDVPGASVKRSVSHWAGRALLEATLARLTSNGVGTL